MKSRLALMAGMISILTAVTAAAQSVPAKINYQGRLFDSGGQPVNDVSMPMEFSLWDKAVTSENTVDEQVLMGGTTAHALTHQDLTPGSETVTGLGGAPAYQTPRDYTMDYANGTITRVDAFSGGFIPDGATVEVDYTWTSYGNTLWSEGQAVEVVNGLYQVRLGAVNQITAPVFAGGSAYLEVVVNGSTLSPRQEVTSVPFALRAEEADNCQFLDGLGLTDFSLAGHTHDFSEITGAVTDAQVPDNITINLAQDSNLLAGQSGSFYLDAGNVNAGSLGDGYFSAYSDLGAEGYLDNSAGGDLITQSQGDGRYVNTSGDDAMAGNFTVGQDLTITGGNLQLGDASSTTYGILNSPGGAPTFGAGLYGTSLGVMGRWTGAPNNFGALGSSSYGVSGTAGGTTMVTNQTGGSFSANSQAVAYGARATGHGYGGSNSYGFYGAGYGDSVGNAYGGYFYAVHFAGSGLDYGLYASGDSYAAWLEGGPVHVGNTGTQDFVDGDGDLYVEDELEVDGVAHFSGGIDAPGAIDAADVNFNWAASSSPGGPANDSNLLSGQNMAFYRNASNITSGTLNTTFFSAYSDLSAEGYLDNSASADLITQGQGDGRYVNQWETWNSDLSVTGDLTVSGNNIGIGRAPSSLYGIINSSTVAPTYGARFAGSTYGQYAVLSSDPSDHYAYLASSTYGAYAQSGNLDETSDRYGASFNGRSQGSAYGVSGLGYGNSSHGSYGVSGQGWNTGSGIGIGINGVGINSGSGNAYGGYFQTLNSGSGTHYGIWVSGDDYAAWLEGGRVHVGNAGTMDYVDGDGDLYVEDELEADGNAYVGGDLAVFGNNIGIGQAADSSYGIINNLSTPPSYGGRFYGSIEGFRAAYSPSPDDHYASLGSQNTGIYARSGNSGENATRIGGSFAGYSLGTAYGSYNNAFAYGTGTALGVVGIATGNSTGQAQGGSFTANAGNGTRFGVLGWAYSTVGHSAYGVYGYASGAGNNYGIYDAAGTKNWVNPDPEDPDKAIVYSTLEGGENGTYYRGTARLVNGTAVIELPDHFRKVTSPDRPITVQVTPWSEDSLGLAVTERSNRRIVVKELQHGTGNYQFDYLVHGVRLGYEDYQPVIDNVDYVPFQGNLSNLDDSEMTTQEFYDRNSKGLKRIFKQNGTLDKDGKVNEAMFKQKGWKDVKEKKEKPRVQGLR